MSAAPRKSRPAAGTAEAADRNGNARPAYDQAGGKASTPPQWFRLDAAKWRAMTLDLKAAERGILIDVLIQIHQRGEPISNDPARIARACGTTKAAFERALAIFLADGRIVVSAGKLWSHYIEAELDNCEKRSQAAKEKASKRWEKSQQNQSDADAAAYRYEDSKIGEGEAPSELHPSSDISNDRRPDARKGASGPDPAQYQVGQVIELPDIGQCNIVKRGTTIATNRAGEEIKIGLLLVRSSIGAEFACPVVIENDQEALRPHLAKRWDEMTDESRKRVRWDRMEAKRASA